MSRYHNQCAEGVTQSTQSTTWIDLLRHGECHGGPIYRGRTDSALTEHGLEQMKRAVGHVNQGPWQRVVSSPLQRCAYFSQWFAQYHSLTVQLEPDLMELDFGDWEGEAIASVWADDRERVEAFYQSSAPDNGPPNGETLQQFRERLLSAWQTVLSRYQGQHVLMVQHGGTIRMLLSALFNIPMATTFQIDIPYASMSRIRIDHSLGDPHCRLLFLNGQALNGCAVHGCAKNKEAGVP